jgi:putative FmdB family regulatory protein
MPLYNYHCKKCELDVEVLRSFAEYEQVPEPEEFIPKAKAKQKKCKHQWERLLGSDIRAFRGANWKGAKGYW